MSIAVIGRFPPPVDGQTLATERLADLLDPSYDVLRVDTQPDDETARQAEGVTVARALHFARLRGILGRTLEAAKPSVALWPAISPDPAGHLRDRLAVLSALERIPNVVAIVHRGNFDKLFTSPWTRRSARQVVDRVATFVFLSTQLSDRCGRWIPESRRSVIPNTIDAALLFGDDEVAAKQADRVNRNRLELLFVGHMIAAKGYLDVLHAAAILRERGLDFRVRFVGGWMAKEERHRFDRRVEQLGLRGAVERLGAVADRGRMKSVYESADMLLLPSYYPNEAQPLVILEALNAGVPVVTTRHGGIPDILEHEREGFLVAPKDPKSLADAVELAAPIERWTELSSAARRRFVTAYAPDAVGKKWMSLIDRLESTRGDHGRTRR